MAQIAIHPAVDKGVKPGAKDFAGGTLRCLCASNPVEVVITGQCAHNHVCGCTKCWKPKGALFSQVAVVSRDKVQVTKNADKLKVWKRALIMRRLRAAASNSGPVEREKHPSRIGLRSHGALERAGWAPPDFARSSRSSSQREARPMSDSRPPRELGLEPMIASPVLMDYSPLHRKRPACSDDGSAGARTRRRA